MDNSTKDASGEANPAEQIGEAERSYSGHGERLGFDPMKELNLPANYDEVVSRFKRLQGSRAMESLN
jgi:hypothetical protein